VFPAQGSVAAHEKLPDAGVRRYSSSV
jgi:iron(III) transport system ATP-binding protein